MRTEDGLVDGHRDIVLHVQIHPGAGKRDPVRGEQKNAPDDLPLDIEMDKKQGGDHVADSDGLQRIGKRMEGFPIEIQQVTLHDPSQQEQQAEALEELQVELPVRPLAFLVPGH